MSNVRLSKLDQLLVSIEEGVRSVFAQPRLTGRKNPADAEPDSELSEAEKRQSIGLMRVNHAGEVAAQGLYQGQALTAKKREVSENMARASMEEHDHLAWCRTRVEELGGRTSWLDPCWYAGSFAIGAAAGLVGDKWSLGFVVETENQVVEHLQGHLQQLPETDKRSRAVIEQMKIDEAAHATQATDAGAAELPQPIKQLMKLSSKFMTTTSFYL